MGERLHSVDSPTRGDALLDVYLVRPESSFTGSRIVERITGHYGVMLEVEWGKFVVYLRYKS